MAGKYLSLLVHSFKEELIGLLEKHGIAYDKRYIWD